MWGGAENVVVVAVRAERDISKGALAWALTHVVRPGDLVTLLAVLSEHHDATTTGWWRRRRLWGFSGSSGDRRERRCQISSSCSQMALQIDGHNEINVRINVVGSEAGGTSHAVGVVAAESNRIGATWVVLDKHLKHEEKHCMVELQCNIVVMKGSHARVLRLKLGGGLQRPCTAFSSSCAPTHTELDNKLLNNGSKHSNPVSRLGDIKAWFLKETRASSSSKATSGAASLFVRQQNPLVERVTKGRLGSSAEVGANVIHACGSDSSSGARSFSRNPGRGFCSAHRNSCRTQPKTVDNQASALSSALVHNREVYWIPQNHVLEESPFIQRMETNYSIRPPSTTRTLQERFYDTDTNYVMFCPSPAEDDTDTSDVREVVSLFRGSPSIPPPLCSLCRHKTPVFGKPPRRYTYRELEEATNRFSDGNFLAEGALGWIHRGLLGDGGVVAVKRLKTDFTASDDEFLAEVELLSRAQHRNVVMLVGYCVEGKMRVLVYEYICNGSLDIHLYGREKPPLDGYARVKIAAGVARGLRYLHEDCRVGFVVHKDLRPNNILLTHDFEPLIGDLSLTGAQVGTPFDVQTHVPRAFGYLAPECMEDGMATSKADVYAFGIILLELLSGRRALDPSRPEGQQFLVEWARPLVEGDGQSSTTVERLLDPCLDPDGSRFFSRQLRAMASAACMCLCRDPQDRPTMSKVLRVLEGDTFFEPVYEIAAVGSRSSRMRHPISYQDTTTTGSLSLRFPSEAVSGAFCSERNSSPFF